MEQLMDIERAYTHTNIDKTYAKHTRTTDLDAWKWRTRECNINVGGSA